MPCDYTKYPPDWQERRIRILKRADNKCENCGAPNHKWVCRVSAPIVPGRPMPKLGQFFNCVYHGDDAERRAKWDAEHVPGYSGAVKIVLTTAHLDHDPENWEVADDRLAAMCQRCHLRYDRENNKQLELFETI